MYRKLFNEKMDELHEIVNSIGTKELIDTYREDRFSYDRIISIEKFLLEYLKSKDKYSYIYMNEVLERFIDKDKYLSVIYDQDLKQHPYFLSLSKEELVGEYFTFVRTYIIESLNRFRSCKLIDTYDLYYYIDHSNTNCIPLSRHIFLPQEDLFNSAIGSLVKGEVPYKKYIERLHDGKVCEVCKIFKDCPKEFVLNEIFTIE